jgi:sterol desaturase/sphingolipid hydroxylase (fatty acid hydroxylase superfamily)
VLASSKLWWLVFVSAFAATGLCETFWPFRDLQASTAKRWTSNSLVFVVTSTLLLFIYQFSGFALALTGHIRHFGLFSRLHASAARPALYILLFALGFAAVDFTAYLGHRLLHRLPVLWRIHQVHHSANEMDLTTGVRFHPFEGLFTQGLQLLTIALLAPPPAAVAAAGLAIVIQDFFTHANLRLPPSADRVLASVFVTPATHRVHHSEVLAEQAGNFGTIFSVWDRFFGTFIDEPSVGHARVRCGLAELAQGSRLSPWRLLTLPFRSSPNAPQVHASSTPGALPDHASK